MTALALAPAGCSDREKAALNALEKDRFLVKTEKAELRDMKEEILLVGSLRALDEATLFPRVSGKLLKNLLNEGDPVKRDQPVALVERDEVGVVYEPAPVPSTLGGIVGRIYQDNGANLTPQTPIALIVDQSKVRVKVDLPERYLGNIHLRQAANISVEAYPGKVFRAVLSKISPVVDSASRSAPIELLAENSDGRLKSGMFVQVRLVVGEQAGAVTIPASSVQQDEKGSYVLLPGSGVARRKDVSVGIKSPDYVQITSGLKPGQRVISFGLYGLRDGGKIEISN